jgi:aminoglycoside 2'-N-acetyltransferase I
MPEADWSVQDRDSANLPAADLPEIRGLMDAAFGDRFSDEDWSHALGGRHFFIRAPSGTIVAHASVVGRRLVASGYQLSTGYVEAVATHPELQRRGLATAIMRAVAEFIRGRFQLGVLSGDPDLYQKLGWVRWRGATWCRHEDDLSRTPEDDGSVLVLPTSFSPPVDLDGDIVVEWRDGDVW